MKGWDGLVSSALLGTDRRPMQLDGLPEAVRERLGEGGLLDAAALVTLYRRAGRRPVRGLEPLAVAPGEDRPVPRPVAVRRLVAMLSGFQTHALGEWLRAADEKGWGVPPEHLPALADYARHRPEYRPLVLAVAGRRAGWLADLNPEWRFMHAAQVADGNDIQRWTHGNLLQRKTWLSTERERDPVSALAALEDVWATETAAIRAEFLGLLVRGLSMADEEFLERVLDDRSVEVRRVAARLLRRLPGSRYAGRMNERVWSYLSAGDVLAVKLPTRVTAAMERDGIDPLAQADGIGKRASWLRQLVAAAPLPSVELLELPVEGCAPEVLQVGWAEAAVRDGAVEWARALLRSGARTGGRVAELLRLLPADEWVPAVQLLRTRLDLADLVGGLPVPWPVPLSRLILDDLAKAGTDRSWARLASIAGRAVPAEVLKHPITSAPVGQGGSEWGRGQDTEDTWRSRLIETLTFRREMYEELS